MQIPDDILCMADELGDMARHEGTEIGEYWGALSDFVQRVNCEASDRIIKALIAEVKSEYKILKRDYELKIETVTVKQAVKTLEYIR